MSQENAVNDRIARNKLSLATHGIMRGTSLHGLALALESPAASFLLFRATEFVVL